mgnify:FL=1|tara:strand:+ start:66 stop:548 length:483 start_codon:yes stop_codon:yes gene_type:complete
MKKLLPILLLAVMPASYADITSSITSSVKLEVAAPGTTADRIGNSYSVSGTGVNTTDGTTAGSLGGLGAATNGVNAYTPITASQLTDGESFSYTVSHTTGDTISTSLTTGEVSPFGDLTSTSGGTAGTLAGTVDNHVVTVTAGGSGTTATGQYVTSVTVD